MTFISVMFFEIRRLFSSPCCTALLCRWHFHVAGMTYALCRPAHIALSLSIWSYAVCVYFTARLSSIWIEIVLHGLAASDWTAQSWFTAGWRWTQQRSWQKTDHGPKVVSHLLPVLKDGPEEEISPRMLAALLQLREVLLAVEQSALRWLLLKHTDRTLDLLNTYRERGSCKQFMQHSISTWVLWKTLLLNQLHPLPRRSFFMFHCLAVIINVVISIYLKKESLFVYVWLLKVDNKYWKCQRTKVWDKYICIKTKHIYINSTHTSSFFIQPLVIHIVLDLVCHENQYVFIFQ